MWGLSFNRHLVVAVASLLMSVVAVGAAVAPSTAASAASFSGIVTYA